MSDIQLGDLLGSGGFGAVYRGWLKAEDAGGAAEEVAVKQLHLEGGQMSQSQLEEFRKEVDNLQSLQHPRLIRFIGVALDFPLLCMVTELAPNGSLHEVLHGRRQPLDAGRRRCLALQLAEGVAFLHGRQPPRVHRDLKSANVVLDADWNAKICDFGLTESMEKTHLSRKAAEAGSPRYMAPELFDARVKLSEKLDIWSLGCLVVEILTNKQPHEGCNTLQQIAIQMIVHAKAPFADEWSAGYHEEVKEVIGACFAREPLRRPAAAELWRRLAPLEDWRAAA